MEFGAPLNSGYAGTAPRNCKRRAAGQSAKTVVRAVEASLPIVGATKLHHLDDAIASLDVKLSAKEIAAWKESYIRTRWLVSSSMVCRFHPSLPEIS